MAKLPALGRKEFIIGGVAAGGAILAGTPAFAQTVTLPFANGTRQLSAYPQKRPLIVMTSRPVQLETPFAIFNDGEFTPNDAFFVRWHLAGIPTDIDAGVFRINVHGLVNTPLQLSIADLKSYDAVEIAAVCECSGNSRGFFNPRVPGGQWANGAMGNALWKGVRLKDILAKAGVKDGAVQVRFNGADDAVVPATPKFMKSLDIDLATSDDVILAYSMNGADLPVLNGYPVRLVVPGYFATYWVKMISDIEVLGEPDQNFWMKTAYRIPADPCGCQQPGTTVKTVPIGRLTVRSFITSVQDGERLLAGKSLTIQGIAFDGGYGIDRVLFSTDGGQHWSQASLGKDYGKYAFRQWQARFTPQSGKQYTLASLAINVIGEAQRPDNPVWNPGGYLRNTVETVRVSAASGLIMMKRLTILTLAAIAAFLVAGVVATRADSNGTITLPPPDNTLKDGPNLALAQTKCLICHSADYIYMQPPLTSKQWTAEVTKMQKTYGAPIADADVAPLVDYLMSQNGKPG